MARLISLPGSPASLRTLVTALLVTVLLCFLGRPAVHAAEDTASLEDKVKAASIYKFLGYVEWPPSAFASPQAPYVIGVAGAPDIARELADITASRSINRRPVLVRQVTAGDALTGVHVLFIGRQATDVQSALLKQAQKSNVLSITETEDGLSQGSVINFRLADGRVRFEVSLAAAERSKLKISSRLLPVAIYVQTGADS